jgi:hypothetical protein
MTRTDDALAKLREWDEAVSPGSWEAALDFSTTLERLAEISPSLSVIPLTAPALPAGKGYGVGWIRTEGNARLASLSKGHLLRLMGALLLDDTETHEESEVCAATHQLWRDSGIDVRCVPCEVLTDLTDAILGPNEGGR